MPHYDDPREKDKRQRSDAYFKALSGPFNVLLPDGGHLLGAFSYEKRFEGHNTRAVIFEATSGDGNTQYRWVFNPEFFTPAVREQFELGMKHDPNYLKQFEVPKELPPVVSIDELEVLFVNACPDFTILQTGNLEPALASLELPIKIQLHAKLIARMNTALGKLPHLSLSSTGILSTKANFGNIHLANQALMEMLRDLAAGKNLISDHYVFHDPENRSIPKKPTLPAAISEDVLSSKISEFRSAASESTAKVLLSKMAPGRDSYSSMKLEQLKAHANPETVMRMEAEKTFTDEEQAVFLRWCARGLTFDEAAWKLELLAENKNYFSPNHEPR
ncbi:hypothetical protein HNP46_006532 [Pseudomonas nitritireducens]|uniref:Uncharacterized protein n=1 Tax=Pseudomonas nitroreducens TaxID=46680 RepID=A0A7W7KSN6_PSENT|nr:hypothetical protein [Pseudomonas nitritireducens]MBB4867618.1 hypothetical protein [Pseudomonas nitritireducens]